MKVSERGRTEIASHEGIVLSPYRDSVGVWTIGIGHTKSAGHPNPAAMPKGKEIPIREAMEIFARDLRKFEVRVDKAFKKPLRQHQYDGATSFDFNTGGIHRATWVKHFNRGDERAARASFMSWSKPKEIIPRRKKERDLFFEGKYSSNGYVPIFPANSKGRIQWGKKKLIKIDKLPQNSAPSIDPAMVDGMLERGEMGRAVDQLIMDLKELGYYVGKVDKIFGPLTEGAVKRLQKAHGLQVDGIAGPKTFEVVERLLKERKPSLARAVQAIIDFIVRLLSARR